MPLIETKGAASAQGFGEFAKTGVATYIEDVFSTWLYTGNGSTQTITNGIDLSTKGGLVWIKQRGSATGHRLTDTARGAEKSLATNNAVAQNDPDTGGLTSFSSTGFSLGSNSNYNNTSGTYVSWTFREQPKFFDVVTYTGTGANRTVAHNLGSVPGCIITKRTDTTGNWITYHRSLGNTDFVNLNTTAAASADSGAWNNTTPTSTEFSLGTGNTNVNGGTYVAYLFAHDAGGFGLTGTDNVISCGSLSGAGTTVNLGWEPQWILAKRTDTTGNWYIDDNMRGWPAAPENDNPLLANSSAAEPTGYAGFANITSTGFTNNFNGDYIYIAIRRGPMKTPTSGTSVFSPNLSAATTGTAVTTGFPVDLQIDGVRPNYGLSVSNAFLDRLRGVSTNATEVGNFLAATSTNAEVNNTSAFRTLGWGNTGYNQDGYLSGTGAAVYWNFRRAPGFFDVVCYTGTGTNTTQTHNLGVVPELIIVKRRNAVAVWPVYYGDATKALFLEDTVAGGASGAWNNTSPTATVFSIGGAASAVNASGGTYVAYLFATVAGVSKVGSYTGTGALQTVNCGFTGGARFVLIKRTDSTGDWFVYDSTRGITSGNDPYLLMNSTAAEVTGTNYVDTTSVGFQVTAAAPAGLNANGGTYIFLAIA